MKRNLWIAALALMTATACVEPQVETPNVPAGKKLTGTIEKATNAASSRAYFDKNFNFCWQSGDKIDVLLTNGDCKTYELSKGAGSSNATFTGSLAPEEVLSTKIAYPVSVVTALSGESVTMSLPSLYEYGEPFTFGETGDASIVLPCQAEIQSDNSFVMKHLGGYFVFEISDIPAGSDKFVFRTTNGMRINGEFTADLTVAEPYFEAQSAEIIDLDTPESPDSPDSPKEEIYDVEWMQTVTVIFAPSKDTTTRCFVIPAPVGEYSYEWHIYAGDVAQGFDEQYEVYINRGSVVGRRVACSAIGGGEDPEDPEVPEDPMEQIIPNNEIWYTSISGRVAPYKTDAFGVNIVSEEYDYDTKFGKIIFDGDVTTIGDKAFGYCSYLKTMKIPNSVTSIGVDAFTDCPYMTNINLGNSVESIGNGAFAGCSMLKTITIPDSVTTIGSFVFRWCDGLESFYGKFASADNRCLIIDGTLHSFAPAGLAEYTIPDNVTEIGEYAFCDCNDLTGVTIGDNVTAIREGGFNSCPALANITIGKNVAVIGQNAFWGCRVLTGVAIPGSVTTLEVGAFGQCYGLEWLTIEDGVRVIEDSVFDTCTGLKSVKIPDSVTEIGPRAFALCDAMKSAVIGDGVTLMGGLAFYGCSALEHLIIGENVTAIKNYTFSKCSSLTSVTIPSHVREIGYQAFYKCDGLEKVYCKPATPPTGDSDMFPRYITIYVPAGSVDAYANAEYWRGYYFFEGYAF